MGIPNWRTLKPGPGLDGEVVIVIDFESASRAEPGFGFMAARLDVPYAFLQPNPEAMPSHVCGAHLVERLANEVLASCQGVRAIFAYCAGSAIACSLASRLTSPAGRPAVLLLDPLEVQGGMISYQFRLAIEQLRGMVEDEEIEKARLTAQALCRADDWDGIAETLPVLYRGLVAQALADLVETGTADELAERYRSYLNYLLTAQQLGYANAEPADVAVFSSESDPLSGFVGRVMRLTLSRPELFTDQSVVGTARDVVLGAGDGRSA